MELSDLLSFLAEVEDDVDYALEVDRPDAITVAIATPGQRWEIQFMTNGEIEVEKFVSDGEIYRPPSAGDLAKEIKSSLV
jgi:hypothetical protein